VKAWIEKISLEGFKSYGKDRVEIPLGQGFIGIVGPNGSGKSNIGDAISFALGIATAKTLRAKNLSYLIYNRNSDRADYAYVEVHFKNYGLFPLQEEDIVISRKVYQDGRTVFRINGAVVRERDLMDFLSKAGIYENAYNVVLQGDIVRFLKMTPVERRKLIEEIAGIEEYEEKKQKALADLGEVELKIRELRLLMDEMEVHMEKLKEELKRLRLYKELEEAKRSLEIKLNLKTAYEFKRSIDNIKAQIESKEEELKELRQRITGYEERLKTLEEELKKLNEDLFPFRERVGRISQSMENIDHNVQAHRPIGVFLFLGPTGVGKTETAKALAEYLFGSEEALIRFDMSEYMEKHTVSRLVGAPPGYVGYEEGGQLTEKVRRRPYSVLLFDEIEKAHPDVFNIFLQIFDDGRLTDAMGRTVDFSNTIIIMTSNLGARLITQGHQMGFEKKFGMIDYDQMKKNVLDQVKRTFSPEFLNRLDEIIVYRPLEKEDVVKILDLQLKQVNESLKEWNVKVKLHKSFVDWIIEKEYKPEYGARSLKRALQHHVEDLLAEELLKGSLADTEVVEIRVKEDKPYIKPVKKKEKLEAIFNQ